MAKAKTKSELRREEIMTKEDAPVVEPTEAIEEVEATPVDFGVVANCVRLAIREKADKSGELVCVVNAGVELEINKSYKNKTWYKVTTKDGKEGFCMKEFVTIK